MKSSTFISALALVALPSLGVLALSPQAAASGRPEHVTDARPVTTVAARLVPAAAPNMVAGYAATFYKPPSYYDYNAAGGAISVAVNTPTTGTYRVTFAGLQKIGVAGDVQVTANSGNVTCVPVDWSNLGSAEYVDVQCYDPGGSLDISGIDAFDVTLTIPRTPPSGFFAYSRVYRATSSGRLTGKGQYNSSRKTNQVKHLGTGRYQVLFPGPKSSGTHGTAEVTPLGAGGGDCVLAGWSGTKAGENVDVDCYSASGSRQNRTFDVVYASANNVLGLNGATSASAEFTGKGAVSNPVEHYFSYKHAEAVAVQYGKGLYQIGLAGSAGNWPNFGGDVQVNAVGSADHYCTAGAWTQNPLPVINVDCYNAAGHFVSSAFELEWIVP